MDIVASKVRPTNSGKTKTIKGRNKLVKATSLDSKKEMSKELTDANHPPSQKALVRNNSESHPTKLKSNLKGRSESAKIVEQRTKPLNFRRNSEIFRVPEKPEKKLKEEKTVSSPNLLSSSQLTVGNLGNAPVTNRKPPFSFSPDCQPDLDRDLVDRSPPKRQVTFDRSMTLRSPSSRDALLRLSPLMFHSIDINERPDYSLNDCNTKNGLDESQPKNSRMKKPTIEFMGKDAVSSVESNDNENSDTDVSCPTVVEKLHSTENASLTIHRSNGQSADTMFERTDNLMKEVTKLIANFQTLKPKDEVTEERISGRSPGGVTAEAASTSTVEYNHPHSTDQLSTSLISSNMLTPPKKESDKNDDLLQPTDDEPSPNAFTSDEIHRKIAETLTKIEQEEMNDFMKSSSSYDDLRRLEEPFQNVNYSFCQFSQAASIPTSRSCSRLSSISSCPPHPHNINCISPRICSSRVSSKPECNSFYTGDGINNDKYGSPYNSQQLTNSDLSLNTRELFVPSPSPALNQMPNPTQTVTMIHMHDPPAAEEFYIPSDDKAKKLFDFLEEVDRSDREALFALKYNPSPQFEEEEFTNRNSFKSHKPVGGGKKEPEKKSSLKTMETLIRKGPVQLAKELILLDRKYDEASQSIKVLEETLLHQRELSMRNVKNSEKDMKKRLKLQKEEFEMAFSRNEALVNEMAIEKRQLQEKLDKLITNFNDAESKYKEHVKALQQKHLDEIKRLRKAQLQAENSRKQQWVGNKTQEIKELTVKGLEPEVQRIIQRHQQEMNELRAWHADEIREIEDRYQRKLNMHQQEIREKLAQELELALAKEKETAKKRLEAEIKLKEDDFEVQKRRLENEIEDLQERLASDEVRLKDRMTENVRKVQVNAEIEREHLKEEFEVKMQSMSRKHENEMQTLKDICEAEKDNISSSCAKKYEESLRDREKEIMELKKAELVKELREKERQLREEFERTRKEDEEMCEARMRRTQDKLQSEIIEMDQREKELKTRLNNAKKEILSLEEDMFALKTSLGQKDKQIHELQDANLKMSEERVNLTSVIRREFSVQIESVEEELRSLKAKMIELQAKHTLELEQKQVEIDKILHDKSLEIERIGFRVQQTISGREETIHELQKQLETSNFHIQHLESLLEQQRKDMIETMTRNSSAATKRK